MTADKTITLDEIRAEIDRIDDAMLGLLTERLAAVEAVRAAKANDAKQPATARRPAREAEILRRLIARRDPRVDAGLVERVWREIISNATHLQTPQEVHVCIAVPLALVHGRFGTATPVEAHSTAADAVRAVLARGPDVAVVGTQSEGDDWVSALLDAGADGPRVESCLPFVDATGRAAAFIVGHALPEATGDDSSVIAIMTASRPESGATPGAGPAGLAMIGASGRWRLGGAKGLISSQSHVMKYLRADPAVEVAEIIGSFANPVRTSVQA